MEWEDLLNKPLIIFGYWFLIMFIYYFCSVSVNIIRKSVRFIYNFKSSKNFRVFFFMFAFFMLVILSVATAYMIMVIRGRWDNAGERIIRLSIQIFIILVFPAVFGFINGFKEDRKDKQKKFSRHSLKIRRSDETQQ